jgi:HEAT repeat protein
MEETFRQDIQHLLLDSRAPASSDYMALDQLPPEELEIVREVWSQAPLARRRKVVQALMELAEESVDVDFGAFFRLALSDPDAEVRRWAIEGLWEDEDSHLVPPLIKLLQHDPAESVRAAAASSLARFVFLSEMEYLCRDKTVKLQAALFDAIRNPAETVEVRRRALEALAFADREEVPDLIAAAYRDPNEDMRLSAVFAMGRACDPAWTETAIAELANPNPAMRYEAARACGEIEAEPALPTLLQRLDDPDQQVREMVLWAFGEIGGPAARRTLRRCLRDPDPGIREAAEEALAELERKESASPVPSLNLGLLPADE